MLTLTPGPTIPPVEVNDVLGVPLAVVALLVSGFSFVVAIAALAWQIMKHFLEGGRVRVYLNTAVWEPGHNIATNRSGKFALRGGSEKHSVTRGQALELAQLVVENPGRTAVTIYSPGLHFSGHGRKNNTVVPRMFALGDSLGPDGATTETVVRLEPYERATFLLDYWAGIPRLIKNSPTGRIVVRGHVSVAGRTKRPQRSSFRKRWKISAGTYTAIEGSPDFTPLAVLWRELFVRLPENAKEDHNASDTKRPLTRELANFVLDQAMSKFDEQPSLEDLKNALEDSVQTQGFSLVGYGLAVWEGYEALKRMEGHLTPWTEGLWYARETKAEKIAVADASTSRDGSADAAPEPQLPTDEHVE